MKKFELSIKSKSAKVSEDRLYDPQSFRRSVRAKHHRRRIFELGATYVNNSPNMMKFGT